MSAYVVSSLLSGLLAATATTVPSGNGTTTKLAPDDGGSSLPIWSGFVLIGASSFLYGSNYLPVKRFETGDGMFFQFILCIAIWTVGFVVHLVRGIPTFYPLPMLGGWIWATGNCCVVPIIRTIGIGLGILIWGAVNLLTGWATVRFGWFGLSKAVPSDVTLNYVGVALILFSAIFYLFVKSEVNDSANAVESPRQSSDDKASAAPLAANKSSFVVKSELLAAEMATTDKANTVAAADASWLDRLGPGGKRLLGVALALFSGVLYAQSNTPLLYVVDNYAHASANNMDHLFAFYTGIFVTSLTYFAIYCAVKRNRPVLYPRVILPGLVSGWMWGMANVCFFLSINALSPSITFPISNSGPPIVASLWGTLLYKEIRGVRNLTILLCGFAVSIAGVICTGLSF